MQKPVILVMTHTAIDNDSRIRRQVQILSERYQVYLIALNKHPETLKTLPADLVFFPFENRHDRKIRLILAPLLQIVWINYLLTQLYFRLIPSLTEVVKLLRQTLAADKQHLYAVIANDIHVLPFALEFKRQSPKMTPPLIIGDMHEVHFDYSRLEKALDAKKRLWLIDTFITKCDLVISVSDQCVAAYRKRYALKQTLTIRNVPFQYDLPIRPTGNPLRLVMISGAQPERKIEHTIDLMELLDAKYRLDLYLIAPGQSGERYISTLKRYIKESGQQDRITLHDPLPPETVVSALNNYDIGIYYLKPTVGNHKYSLPNKFFEYIQARLGVVTTDISSMRKIIETYDVGTTATDFTLEAFATAVEKVAARMDYYKQQSDRAASVLNAQQEWRKLLDYLQNPGITEHESKI